MTREWKPGDVAICTIVNGTRESSTEILMRAEERSSREWISPFTHQGSRLVPDSYVEARPLVVIDPEDRERVERLAVAYATVESARSGDEYRAWENRSAEARERITDSLSAALREFANPKPPKPDEPMGLGAVVEARCGCQAELRRFVRQGDVDPDDPWEAHCGWHVYADLDAVRVLSPGWEADK